MTCTYCGLEESQEGLKDMCSVCSNLRSKYNYCFERLKSAKRHDKIAEIWHIINHIEAYYMEQHNKGFNVPLKFLKRKGLI